jgi:arabinose-5-phosphate isomerase
VIEDRLAQARAIVRTGASALDAAADRLDGRFQEAVEILRATPGKILVSGLGKSGIVARKIAATLSSTGNPAVFLHPTEAAHGDLGLCGPGDPALLLSKSGATEELLRLAPVLRRNGSKLVGVLGNPRSPLADAVDVALDASVEREADPNDMVPTTSALVSMALGDALAIALMREQGFTADDFSRLHPGGQIGRNLNVRVADAMHQGAEVAWAAPDTPVRDLIVAMTSRPLGAACVVDQAGHLAGLVTDGDLRRALLRFEDIRPLTAAEVMTKAPVRIGPDARLLEAVRLMEQPSRQISVLPVVDQANRCLGLLRLHDLYRS